MITREALVRIARDAAGGLHRPPDHCEGSYVTPWGTKETVTLSCEHTIRNPESYDPPEWILDALRRAYLVGCKVGAGRMSHEIERATASLVVDGKVVKGRRPEDPIGDGA